MLLNRIGIQTNSNQRVWIFNDVIQSVNIRNRAKVDPQKPTFGIIAAEGSFVFKDTEKRFAKYCQDGEVGTNNEVFIHLYDTITNKHQTIARLKTQRWDFDADTYTMTVTLRDDIEDLQEIEVNDTSTSIELAQNPMTALELYNYIREKTPSNYLFETLSEDVQNLLSSIVITYAYLQAGSLWGYYEDICQLALLYMYKTTDGKIKLDIIR